MINNLTEEGLSINASGIYKILCTENNHCYVGSSRNIKNRWSAHHSDLRRDRHANVHLQNAWNKYGSVAFVFSVIEECPIDILNRLSMSEVIRRFVILGDRKVLGDYER